MNRRGRHARWPLLIGLLFLLALIPFALYRGSQAPEAEAAWWNPSWQYRQRVPITYSGTEHLTEYQVLVDELDTASLVADGKLQTDCADLRFVSRGGILLDYSIVGNTCNTTNTQIWVKTDQIPGGDIDIMMYYGNGTANSYQDEVQTFSYQEEKTVGYILHSGVDQLEVISLTDNNTISHNGNSLNLAEFEAGQLTSIDQWGAVAAKGLFNADDESDDTDMLVPVSWAGTEFAFYSRYNNHRYYAIAPWGQATIDVYLNGSLGCASQTVATTGSTVSCNSLGTGNVTITSDLPILIFTATNNGIYDQMPLRPTSTGKWIGGGRTPRLLSLSGGASYTYSYDTKTGSPVSANANAYSVVSLPGYDYYGVGAILAWSNDNPISLDQQADGDGNDQHELTLLAESGTRWGSAVSNTDYISIASDQAATCTVYNTTGTQLGQTTLTSSNTDVYWGGFGTGSSNSWTTDDWYMQCDRQVAAHFQKGADSESGLWTYPMMRQFTYPTPTVGTLAVEEIGPGPVAYWKFDEGSGSTANDSAGNNTGTITGAIWTDKDQCISGKCLSFNGISNFVEYTNNIPFDSNDFSISTWIRMNGAGGGLDASNFIFSQRVDSTGNGRPAVAISVPSSSQKITFSIRDNVGAVVNLTPNPTLNYNTWYHIAAIKTNSNISLYLNGQLIGSQNHSLSGDFDEGSVYRHIGKHRYGGADRAFFNGLIDEPKIFPYALTEDQIKVEYNLGAAVVMGTGPTVVPPAGGTLSDSLVAHWALDEQYGQTAHDKVGNNHGTFGASTSPGSDDPTWTAAGECKVNGCLGFDGADYVNVGNQSEFQGNHFSLSFWMKSSTNNDSIITKGMSRDILSNRDWDVFGNGTNLIFLASDGTNSLFQIQTPYPSLNTWHHVVATWDGTTNANGAKIYIDGHLKAQGTATNINVSTSHDLHLGGYRDSYYYTGLIDEVKIYNTALTADQVKQDMNAGASVAYSVGSEEADELADGAGAPPIAEWKFDEKQGTIAYDSSGNANDGTVNGATWKSGCQQGACLVFDGNDYVAIPDHSVLSPGTENYTVNAWINTSNDFATSGWIYSNYGINASNLVWVTMNSADQIGCGMRDGDGDSTGAITPKSYNDGKWHFVSCVRNGTTIYTYIDGSLKNSATNSNIGAIDTTGRAKTIGKIATGSSEYFSGLIDHVRIYNYARTPAQIAYDYNRGAPVAHWKFDECEGTVAHDASGNENHGTITIGATGTQTTAGTCSTSGAWANGASGKFEGSLNFDGTDDYVDTTTTVQVGSPHSISAWVHPKTLSTGDNAIVSHNGTNFIFDFNDNDSIRYRTDGSGTDKEWAINPTDYLNTWSHLLITIDASSEYCLYINGLVESCQTSAPAIVTQIVQIGARQNGGSGRFDGQIDDVRIYNYALSSAQIQKVYNQGYGVRYGPSN